MQVQVPVTADRQLVIPDLNGAYPSYFIYGPMVFSKATVQLTRNFLTGTRAGRFRRLAQRNAQPAALPHHGQTRF